LSWIFESITINDAGFKPFAGFDVDVILEDVDVDVVMIVILRYSI
jgi:hypothetical protein